jgi:hypothetical protein
VPEGETDRVGEDQYLAVAFDARSDADSRDMNALGDDPRDLCWDALEHQGKNAGLFEFESIFDQFARSFHCFALDLVTAHPQDGLGCESDVSHERNLGIDNGFCEVASPSASFDFDGIRAAFLDEANSGLDCAPGAVFVMTERHVADYQGAMGASADGSCRGDHLVEGDWKRRVIPESGLGKTIAYEDDVEAGFVCEPGAGIVVRGYSGDGRRALACANLRDSDSLQVSIRDVAHQGPPSSFFRVGSCPVIIAGKGN